ncbi:MAG: carbohydrate ABC transporter permease [Actinobacteria bacterium]|nr:carbohydrate ABC transporter permease [Actinomycetota bacterium]
MNKNPFIRLKRFFLYFTLTILMGFFMFPVYWIFFTSIQGSNLFVRNISFIPRSITFSNYLDLFVEGKFYIVTPLINSLRVALLTTIVCLILGIFSSYAFARLRFKGSTTIFYLLIFTEMLPPISFLIPLYILFRRLALINTFGGLMIGYTAWLLPIVTWILYSYFKTIPQDLEDSARIDGCTRVGALFRVVIPVSFPGIAASAVVCFIFSIGEFIFALTVLTQEKVHTLPLALSEFVLKYSVEYGKLAAASIIMFLFPILFALIFQKFLVKGLTAGAVKE